MADNPNTAEPGKTRRPWYQFRLRTLLISVVLLAIPCAVFARYVHERQEAERLEEQARRASKLEALDKVGSYLREGKYDESAEQPTAGPRH